MPLTSAIQSAMAIRHEREKRHQRRLSKIRRESGVGYYSYSSSLEIILFFTIIIYIQFKSVWFAGGKFLKVLDLQVESLAGSGGGSHRPSVSSLGAASTRTEVSSLLIFLILSSYFSYFSYWAGSTRTEVSSKHFTHISWLRWHL